MTENITRIADLRVGDIVRLEGGSWRNHFAEGREFRVESIDLATGEARVEGPWFIYDAPDTEWPFVFVRRPGDEDEEDAPEVPEGLTFARYHESMFPMIETLSKAADEAGYCHEYDRMARSIGAPTRAEVRRIVQERDGRRYLVTIPVTVNIPVQVTAQNETEARNRAMNSRLPGTSDDWTTFEASTNSWRGLKAAAMHVLTQVSNYPTNDELSYDGVGSFIIREI
jgi:hypothetical protein